MKRLFRIDESEKDRILGMHKSAISRQYLKEQENDATDQADAGEETSQETTTDQTSSQETYSCDEVDEYLKDEGVKKWIDNLKVNRWVVQKGTQVYDDRTGYEGTKKVIAVIQCKLEMEPDGIFGDDTKDKVEAFQVENGLKKDGKVGKNTIAKLFETESETDTETENNNQNECYMSLGREPIEGQGEEMAGYEVTRVVEDENGNKKVFGFNTNGSGNLNKGACEQSNPFKWSCENGELKFWQEVQF